MVLRQGLGLAIAGAAVGLVFAVIVAHLMAGLLYGVRPTDPLTFAGVALLVIGVVLLACYIPARRATRIDPLVALRQDESWGGKADSAAVADRADLIQQQGDAGLDKTTKFPFGNRLVHNSYKWMFVIKHSGEHYGQLVVYSRANNLVPPNSRR